MVGIERIAMYVPNTAITMEAFCDATGTDLNKCVSGLGQTIMAVPSPDEDCVTMGAAAAKSCLDGEDPASVSAVIISTESGIDQSKAASVYIHSLLELPSSCLCWEVKQACSGSTMALLNALDFVARRPDKKVLVIASDIALYEHGSPGELTQGAGAIAVLVSHSPRLLQVHPQAGFHTEDVMDFWRPNYSSTAKVDGRFSIKMYRKAVAHCWRGYQEDGGLSAERLARICFHQPFTRMADKALGSLSKVAEHPFPPASIATTQVYNRAIGNTYSASLLISLCSLLEQDNENLEGSEIGLFGYGSGAVAAFYGAKVVPGYREYLSTKKHTSMLEGRTFIDYATYLEYTNNRLPSDGGNHRLPTFSRNAFRLEGISEHKRIYSYECGDDS